MPKKRMTRWAAAVRAMRADQKLEPDIGFDVSDFNLQSAVFSALFPSTDQISAKSVLSDFMSPFICTGQWFGKPTSIERFLEEAIEAITIYANLRELEDKFDRERAKPVLEAAAKANEQARTRIIEIEQWQELSNYLQILSRDVIRSGATEQSITGLKSIVSTKGKRQAAGPRLNRAMQESDRPLSLRQIVDLLVKLQPILETAIKQITFRPGDAQRDVVAQTFTDLMVAAWCSGTGQLPTASRRSKRTRNSSPFCGLLATINSKILPEPHRSDNDFREYAIKSVKRLKAPYA